MIRLLGNRRKFLQLIEDTVNSSQLMMSHAMRSRSSRTKKNRISDFATSIKYCTRDSKQNQNNNHPEIGFVGQNES